MAGITAMGDLSHELESLVNLIDSGGATAGPAAFDVMQASVDELARMRDSVAAGRGGRSGRAIASPRIRALLNPGQAEVPAPAEVPQPPQAPEVPDSPKTPPEPEAPKTPELPDTPQVPEVPQSPPPPAELPTTSFEMLTESAFEAPSTAAALEIEILPPEAPFAPEPALPAAPALVPPGREPVAPGDRPEMARVDADLLDQLLNVSGEVSISRARLEQQMGSIEFNLGELSRTVTRLKEQQRKLEIETEKQILHGHEEETGHRAEFDPLELDRYSAIPAVLAGPGRDGQ